MARFVDHTIKGGGQLAPTGGPAPVPTLTLTGPLTYATNAAAGTLVANIGNVPAGVTPTITPNDGRLVVAGSAGAWTVVTGMTAATAGPIALAAAAAGAAGASATVTVTPVPTPAPSFTAQPAISPSSGAVGATFAGSDGTISNGTVSARQWLLNGSAISGATGASYVSTAAGTLTYQVTATGAGGTASATSAGATVTSASGSSYTPNSVTLAAPATAATPPLVWDKATAINSTFTKNGTMVMASAVGTTANGRSAAVTDNNNNYYFEMLVNGEPADFTDSRNQALKTGLTPSDYPQGNLYQGGYGGFAGTTGIEYYTWGGYSQNGSSHGGQTATSPGGTIQFYQQSGSGNPTLTAGADNGGLIYPPLSAPNGSYPAFQIESAGGSQAAITLVQRPEDWKYGPPSSGGISLPGVNDDVAGAKISYPQLKSRRFVYQRETTTGGSQNRGQGTIPVPVTIAATCTPQWRLRDCSTNAVLQSGILAVQQAGAATLFLPVDARLGWFYVDLSEDGGSTWLLGTREVGMGAVLFLVGQSYLTRLVVPNTGEDPTTIAQAGLTVGAYGSGYVSAGDNYIYGAQSNPYGEKPGAFTQYRGAGFVEFLNRQVTLRGVNCMISGHVEGSQTIASYLANTPYRSRLSEIGGFEALFFWLGGSDAQQNTTATAYKSGLDTLRSNLTSGNKIRGSNFEMYMTAISNWASIASTNANAVNVIRGAMVDWCTANGAINLEPNDITLGADGTHPTQAGCVAYADHAYRASKGKLFGGVGDFGPSITGASRSGATITLSTNLASGASLMTSGNWWKRFNVYPAGTTSNAATISGGSVNGSQITLTLSAAPSGAVDVWAFRAGDGDPQNDGSLDVIRDNVVDGDGISYGRQVQWTPNALAAG